MKFSIKIKALLVFFLTIAYVLGTKTLASELYFLISLLLSIVSLIIIFLIAKRLTLNIANIEQFKKKVLLFMFFLTTGLILVNLFQVPIITSILELSSTGGILLFLLYLVFYQLFKPDLTINSLFGLLTMCILPIFTLANLTYGAETFGVLGFLLFCKSSYLFILETRND